MSPLIQAVIRFRSEVGSAKRLDQRKPKPQMLGANGSWTHGPRSATQELPCNNGEIRGAGPHRPIAGWPPHVRRLSRRHPLPESAGATQGMESSDEPVVPLHAPSVG